jgi:uncharacterized protein (DUF1778 family)
MHTVPSHAVREQCAYDSLVPTISLRIDDQSLAELDARADRAGLSRTAFVLRAALDRATADERLFESIEERLVRAEELLFAQ